MSAETAAATEGMTPSMAGGSAGRPPRWPGDPDSVSAADVDFEALAHVLANTCRFGGRTRHYHSLAAHALIASEEIEALDGLGDEARRTLALHALLKDAPSAWLGGGAVDSQRAAERNQRLAARIERSVREAAGLDAVLGDEHAELVRFVSRMTAAAERRDLACVDAGGGAAFPPLKRRIRPVGPGRAAQAWLARFRALARPPGGDASGARRENDDGEAGDGANGQAKPAAAGTEGKHQGRKAA